MFSLNTNQGNAFNQKIPLPFKLVTIYRKEPLALIWGKEHSGYTARESVNQLNLSGRQYKSVLKTAHHFDFFF